MGLLELGTLVKVTDEKQGYKNIKAVVLAHNGQNNCVAFRIVANDYVGHVTHMTNRNNCEVIGRYEGKIEW
jgi:hypothetical protein